MRFDERPQITEYCVSLLASFDYLILPGFIMSTLAHPTPAFHEAASTDLEHDGFCASLAVQTVK